MIRRCFWKFTIVFLTVSASLLLGIAVAQTQTQPAAGKAKADRLVMGLIEKYRDYMRPWIAGTPVWQSTVPQSTAASCGGGRGPKVANAVVKAVIDTASPAYTPK